MSALLEGVRPLLSSRLVERIGPEKVDSLLDADEGLKEFELMPGIDPVEWIANNDLDEDDNSGGDSVFAITDFLDTEDTDEEESWRILWFSGSVFGAVYDGSFDADVSPFRYRLCLANLRLYSHSGKDLGRLPDALLERCARDNRNTLGKLSSLAKLEWTTRLRDELGVDTTDSIYHSGHRLCGRLEEYQLVVPEGKTPSEALASCTHGDVLDFFRDTFGQTRWCVLWLSDKVFWTIMECPGDLLEPYLDWIYLDNESWICGASVEDTVDAFVGLAPFLAADRPPLSQNPQDPMVPIGFDLRNVDQSSDHNPIPECMERAWTQILSGQRISSRFRVEFSSARFRTEQIRKLLMLSSLGSIGGLSFFSCSMEDGGLALAETLLEKGSPSGSRSLKLEWRDNDGFFAPGAIELLVDKGLLDEKDNRGCASIVAAIENNKRLKSS